MQTRGKREKGGRKIRKKGWLSDYSPLYMGAAGESDRTGGGWRAGEGRVDEIF